MCYFT